MKPKVFEFKYVVTDRNKHNSSINSIFMGLITVISLCFTIFMYFNEDEKYTESAITAIESSLDMAIVDYDYLIGKLDSLNKKPTSMKQLKLHIHHLESNLSSIEKMNVTNFNEESMNTYQLYYQELYFQIINTNDILSLIERDTNKYLEKHKPKSEIIGQTYYFYGNTKEEVLKNVVESRESLVKLREGLLKNKKLDQDYKKFDKEFEKTYKEILESY